MKEIFRMKIGDVVTKEYNDELCKAIQAVIDKKIAEKNYGNDDFKEIKCNCGYTHLNTPDKYCWRFCPKCGHDYLKAELSSELPYRGL